MFFCFFCGARLNQTLFIVEGEYDPDAENSSGVAEVKTGKTIPI